MACRCTKLEKNDDKTCCDQKSCYRRKITYFVFFGFLFFCFSDNFSNPKRHYIDYGAHVERGGVKCYPGCGRILICRFHTHLHSTGSAKTGTGEDDLQSKAKSDGDLRPFDPACRLVVERKTKSLVGCIHDMLLRNL